MIPHHVNPTTNETVRFMKSTKYTSIRILKWDGNIYVWDAFRATHVQFMKDELIIEDMKDVDDLDIRANIDPYHNSEGTSISKKFYEEDMGYFQLIFRELSREFDVGVSIDKSKSRSNLIVFKVL